MSTLESIFSALTGTLAAIITFFGAIGLIPIATEEPILPLQTVEIATTTPELPAESVPDSETPEKDTEQVAEEPGPAPQAPQPAPKPQPEPDTASASSTGQTAATTSPEANTDSSAPLSLSFSQINDDTRAALVNILCTTSGSDLNPISGSGVIIDERGVVATNAHIAQYFLLRNYPTAGSVKCTLRTGAPAKNTYRAELLYLPVEWVNENAGKIVESSPTGTGAYDFAFLRITERIDGAPLGKIPHIPFETSDPKEDEPVLLAGYAAGFLGSILISQELYITSALTTIQQLYTFDLDSIDLISVGGTVVSQRGSSGGATVDRDGNLIGLIVTASVDGETKDRELRAVTLSHADRHMRATLGVSLDAFIKNEGLAARAANFQNVIAPTLTAELHAALTR